MNQQLLQIFVEYLKEKGYSRVKNEIGILVMKTADFRKLKLRKVMPYLMI